MKEKDGSWDWINMVIGLSFLAFGSLSIITETIGNSVNRTAQAEGTVVGIEWKTVSLEHSAIAFPTVKFVTESGRSIVFTSNSNTGGSGVGIGESVTVRYDPADPTDARNDSLSSMSIVPVIFIVVGGVLIYSHIRRRGKLSGTPEPDASQNG